MTGRRERILMGSTRKVSAKSRALLAVTCGIFGPLSGCSTADDKVPLVYSSDFERTLAAKYASGQTVALSDLTDFDWDTVTMFGPYTPNDFINETVGAVVVDSEHFFVDEGQSLLVFCDGAPVSSHVIGFYVFPSHLGNGVTHSADAVLQPQKGEVPPGKDRQMEIVEPSGVPVEPNCAS